MEFQTDDRVGDDHQPKPLTGPEMTAALLQVRARITNAIVMGDYEGLVNAGRLVDIMLTNGFEGAWD